MVVCLFVCCFGALLFCWFDVVLCGRCVVLLCCLCCRVGVL